MKRSLGKILRQALLCFALTAFAPAFAIGLDPAFEGPPLGPQHAKGVVVWSHGRSINSEDSESPSPAYLQALRDDGWEVMRFNRLSRGDTLPESTKRLTNYVSQLKQKGYKRVVLAGQSFGAFLALMSADASNEVDAVIATAPAAYGNFEEFYDSWKLNATRLYPLLEQVKSARVMMFYFHGDDFDPGGRGDKSRSILANKGVPFSVVDQPAFLNGHWASSTGLFLRRYGNCIRDFINADKPKGEQECTPRWGSLPSAELKLPPELGGPHKSREPAAVTAVATTGSGTPGSGSGKALEGVRDTWYGFYPNGREVVLAVETVRNDNLGAIYAIGPSIDNKSGATWSRRGGRIVNEGFVFEESGKSTLRFRMRPDGGLNATWIAPDGKTSMSAHLRHIDPQSFLHRDRGKLLSAPVTPAASHGDSEESED